MIEQKQQLEDAVNEALIIAKKLGVDQAEVALGKSSGSSVNTRLGEVENVEFNLDGAMGISVYVDQCKGSASTSDLSPEAIASTVKAAVDIARYTSKDKYAGLLDKELLETAPQDLDLYHPSSLNTEQLLALAKECEDIALSSDKRIVNSDGAAVNSHSTLRVYGNSNGFLHSYASSRHSLSCVLIAQQDDDMQRDYSYTSARDMNDLLSAKWVADETVKRTLSRLGATKIKTQEAPVLFAPEVATGLFGHLVGAISGTSIYKKSTFLLDSLDTQIFPSWMKISEKPHIIKGIASSPFDQEGGKTIDRNIIEQGVLQTYLLTGYAARQLKMQSTGHTGGIHNWFVNDSGLDLAGLFKEMGTGFFVTELMGQGVNMVTGDYSRGASGFWIENGVIAYPVHEVTIAGNLKEMFMGIEAIGSDVDARSSLKTGSILINKMKIAGA
ncbi:metalloprotease PmbA [Psychromonas sp. Urea-02u-13]|uniref:metalloprotease PmbA n=1 Tax=Psychromonas sp. Urea-02u-13 TaxID=2058326 RepID=UPI000C329963|nr:metalloprotease PmbA [Psychromonas sp. Urea-02u-13]PKG39645.1 metalloprotease PmbA [Psychromonas sp. Urea-02u-13]